jgi:hypothetical protein
MPGAAAPEQDASTTAHLRSSQGRAGSGLGDAGYASPPPPRVVASSGHARASLPPREDAQLEKKAPPPPSSGLHGVRQPPPAAAGEGGRCSGRRGLGAGDAARVALSGGRRGSRMLGYRCGGNYTLQFLSPPPKDLTRLYPILECKSHKYLNFHWQLALP